MSLLLGVEVECKKCLVCVYAAAKRVVTEKRKSEKAKGERKSEDVGGRAKG